jgi:heme/copper-type cytochrome/quinol oxidase subunit 2
MKIIEILLYAPLYLVLFLFYPIFFIEEKIIKYKKNKETKKELEIILWKWMFDSEIGNILYLGNIENKMNLL